ncbi:LysR family transcriptional regulator [Shimia aestuarii]|uniref:LysR family transcriptional regulator n=1 Tax=Shimia aestuarii TaxID=254406 RepID=UPI001FB2C844|nr:LysR family transcriptional regulator [Shimia aestuarii]
MNAMRAFEAAARLGGFTRAAEELCVTPGAIAQQVKALEAWAGAALFERGAQGVRLTSVGERVLPKMVAAFDAMGLAVGVLREAARPERLHVAALPAIAQLWLSPRLPEVRRAMPELEVSITAMETPPNLGREPFDLTVFYGDGGGLCLARDVIFPVCAPQVAKGLSTVDDLATVPCLGDAVWREDWALWLRAVEREIDVSGPVYSLYALAVEETVNGAGVLMGHGALVARHLRSGALVAPFGPRVATGRWLEAGMRSVPTGPAQALLDLLCGEGGFEGDLDHV